MADEQELIADLPARGIIGEAAASPRDRAELARQLSFERHVARDDEQDIAPSAAGQFGRDLDQAIDAAHPGVVREHGDLEPRIARHRGMRRRRGIRPLRDVVDHLAARGRAGEALEVSALVLGDEDQPVRDAADAAALPAAEAVARDHRPHVHRLRLAMARAQPAREQEQAFVVEVDEVTAGNGGSKLAAERFRTQQLADGAGIAKHVAREARQRVHARHRRHHAAWNAEALVARPHRAVAPAPDLGSDRRAIGMAEAFVEAARRAAEPAFDVEAQDAQCRHALSRAGTASMAAAARQPRRNSASITDKPGRKSRCP